MSNSVIQQMVLDAESQISMIDSSISGLEDQISELQEKQDALEEGVCDKAAEDLESYLIGEKFSNDHYLVKGSNFNKSLEDTGSLTDWEVYIDEEIEGGGGFEPVLIYSYIEGNDENVDKLVNDWDFGHDYIIKPLSSAGTYGTKDMIEKLNTAKSMLEANKQKITDSITVFESY